MENDRIDVLVLFSGGRDSSLACCLLANQGLKVHLLQCSNGVSIGGDLADYRYTELRQAFQSNEPGRTVVSTMGLFRRISLQEIEADFAQFRKNLIILGSQLAIHAEAIVFAQKHAVLTVASGFTAYQKSYAEQMPAAVEALTAFFQEYGIRYITPLSGYQSEDDVKYRLLDFGVSTKSLEAVSIFADTSTVPTPEEVCAYIQKKLPICRNYIAQKCNETILVDRT